MRDRFNHHRNVAGYRRLLPTMVSMTAHVVMKHMNKREQWKTMSLQLWRGSLRARRLVQIDVEASAEDNATLCL